MRDINLLPGLGVETEKKKKSLGTGIYLLLVLLVPALMWAYDALVLRSGNDSVQAAIETAEANIRIYSEIDSIISEVERLQKRQTIVENLIVFEQSRLTLTTAVLDLVASVMPEDIFSASLSIDDLSTVSMTGVSRTSEAIASFVNDLKHEPGIHSVALLGISKNNTSEGAVQNYNFSIMVQLAAVDKGGEVNGGTD